MYGYTLAFVSTSCGFDLRPSKSLLHKIFTVAPESAIMRIGVFMMVTRKIGLPASCPCAPMLKVYSSLLSLSTPTRDDISLLGDSSTSADLTWYSPLDVFFGREDLDRLLGLPRQTLEKWFILPQFKHFLP